MKVEDFFFKMDKSLSSSANVGKFLHTFTCRIATYPVDKIIHSLNNWDLNVKEE